MPAGQDLRKSAVALFTFLRELVSLRTTVVRNVQSYDRVLWIDEVPKESECDCVEFRPGNDDSEEDWWLQVRKPTFSDPPQLPEQLLGKVDAEQLRDSSLEAPPFKEARRKTDPAAVENPDQAALRQEYQRYVSEKWKLWAEEDKRKRRVLRIYTDLFSLYQQQKELGEAYEVILAIGQLRWIPKPGVEVNRHLVAVQTSIEFDSQKGVITVSPAAEGAKPRMEEDMLELDERPSPDVLTSLEEEVSRCDDDIWRNDKMINALKSFVHSLGGGDGSYSDELKPIDHATTAPQVHYAPAIIVRGRTEAGLLQVYGRILEDLKKRPDVPQGLLPLLEIGWQAREHKEAVKLAADGSPDLVFPLHSNEEQREIVTQLTAQSGVVVQGPPGTGKSHTIANLVCHLLATGNRVLVTSHAPRALRILKDKIPQAITNMCVVLLGNDRTALTELESSVQMITQQLNTWNPPVRAAAVNEVEAQLATVRARAAEVDKDLRAFRESDTHEHPPLPGGYGGTLQKVAQSLRAQQHRHAWLAQFAQGLDLENLPEQPGISNDEALQLLAAVRKMDARHRADLQKLLPPPEEAPTPEVLQGMVDEEERWKEAAQQARASVETPLPADFDADEGILKELCDLLEQIVRHNSEMAGAHFAWVPKLARDVRAGQYETWKQLLEQTKNRVAAIKKQPENIYELEVINLGEIDIATLHEDIETIFKHLAAGGKLKRFFRYISPAKERRYIFSMVRIGGKRVRNMEVLKQLRAWTEVQFQLLSLRQSWSDIAEAPQGAIVRRLPLWNQWCTIIDSANQLHMLIQRARELLGKFSMIKLPDWNHLESLQLLHKQVKVLVVQKEHLKRRQAINHLAEQAAHRAARSNTHPIVAKIADTVKARDVESYRFVHSQIAELHADREKWAHGEQLLKKIAEHMPKFATALSDDPSDSAWDERLANLSDSWLWLKGDRWLKQQLDPRHFEYLQTERKTLQDHLQAAMVKLAAEKAWHHCMARMTPAEETYLKAWVQAIKNIGAGTGKRAKRFRKVARQTLDRCRSAIPAWIMPIHRVAETIIPGEDRFDVVIVDEASQSGPEALFLHYIAKKIIIVGDDKQIAPYNVGINRDDVELLRSRHISHLPLADYFDLEHSFFDQAYLRFGNRIRLCEHFRCMPEIIQFSNSLCYSNEPLLPLRQYGDGRLEPVVVARHCDGHMDGVSPSVANKVEAEAICKQIAKLVADPAYKDKTFGVISLLGDKQARLIESKLLAAIGPEEMERRRLICGDAYSFQGDERHVMFISLVVAADDGRRLATLTQPADERRFNVAASRARDQMWLFHSVNPDDLSQKCLRRRLLEYCLNPQVPQEPGDDLPFADLEAAASNADRARVPAPPPFESWLEVDVYLQIRRRGFRVLAQHAFAGYKIDLVASGTHARLAVECDGEDWNGQERYDADMARRRQLERCGWRFWRIRGGTFYRNPESAMQPLWDLLERTGIKPLADVPQAAWTAREEEPEEVPVASKRSRARKSADDDEPAEKKAPRRKSA
ncbi:MAG TPA: AAA domain-containing protein [Tepidisphaeraceae bacterium]|jgi:very-short-patch-repair endonuclease|nr:AAA domain-containing protein [Tepidisphaeraceae bacterium]